MGKLREGKTMSVQAEQQPTKPLEEQIADLKRDYYIAKGNVDQVVDGMLAKVISTSLHKDKVILTQGQALEAFKKIVPKEKWPPQIKQN